MPRRALIFRALALFLSCGVLMGCAVLRSAYYERQCEREYPGGALFVENNMFGFYEASMCYDKDGHWQWTK